MLFLNDDVWNGKRLLSSKWISKAITPSKPNVNYGYMWWLNTKGNRHWKRLSENIFYAAGFGGNFIVVDVDLKNNLVVVTRWLQPLKIREFMLKMNATLH